ncbi:unnamed protein product [Urochloa humidicola]
MVRTTVSISSARIAKQMGRGTGGLTTLWRGRLLHASSPRFRVGFIGPRAWILALILVITLLVRSDLVRGTSSAMLPEQRMQPATAAPQARILHLHGNADTNLATYFALVHLPCDHCLT